MDRMRWVSLDCGCDGGAGQFMPVVVQHLSPYVCSSWILEAIIAPWAYLTQREADTLRAAYRRKAMALHPDRDALDTTTVQLQLDPRYRPFPCSTCQSRARERTLVAYDKVLQSWMAGAARGRSALPLKGI
ncbi:hypothetical protein ASB57_09255 [Bordetella sp. N]|nr:hypothetical protein ASB57_09255 [Bordetella sp. N]